MRSPLGRIAEILATIDDPPHIRARPNASDLPGDFREWFDGGAVKVVTGATSYHFQDGAVASMPVTPSLIVHISLPDGTQVTLQEQR